MRQLEETGIEGGGFPYVSAEDIEARPVAIVQAYPDPHARFGARVVYVLHLLEALYDKEGEAVGPVVQLGIKAVLTGENAERNPRVRYLDYFADRAADPIGPVALAKRVAQNETGWAWAWESCPLPTEAPVEDVERLYFRQPTTSWRELAAGAPAPAPHNPPALGASRQAPASGMPPIIDEPLEDLPF